MKRMVRYKLKPDRVAENERLVAQVYAELERVAPAGLHYATFKLDDGVSFVHIASNDAEGGNPLTELGSFKAFVASIRERCEEPPATLELTEVGSYAFFGR